MPNSAAAFTCDLHMGLRIVAYLAKGSERVVGPGGGNGTTEPCSPKIRSVGTNPSLLVRRMRINCGGQTSVGLSFRYWFIEAIIGVNICRMGSRELSLG